MRKPAARNGTNGHANASIGHLNGPGDVITVSQGWKLLDKEARRSLGMSARAFVKAWHDGEFDGKADRPEVMRVAMLLPLAR